MARSITHLCTLVLICVLAGIDTAYAVCLDPKTFISGYKLPLDDEIRSSKTIVIGQVTKARYLQEDATDPDGITAYIYTVHVLRQIKGRLPKTISLRTENDSGRYSMEVGEKHLLFLHKEGKYLEADSCGNSSPLPGGDTVLRHVEEALAASPNAP